MKQEAVLLSGLPGSGKTTWAEAHCIGLRGERFVHINRDDLRDALHFGVWKPRLEKTVIIARDALIRSSLAAGNSIIVDETFTNPAQYAHVRDLIAREFPDVVITDKHIDTPLQECIKRDLKRGPRAVGAGVIRRMARQRAEVPLLYCSDLPSAVICDIDGTLALIPAGSNVYRRDYSKDLPNFPVINVVNTLAATVDNLILVSGRDEQFRPETVEWLRGTTLRTPDALLMRPSHNHDHDYVVKRNLYDRYIRDKYAVVAVFDDRDQTVDEWRQLGLPTFQVADGGF